MNHLYQSLLVLILCLVSLSVSSQNKVEWLSWDDAISQHKQNPKKLYIDIYTEWCGWCKKMDKSTFTDPGIVELLNTEYYPIKFDAEQSQTIQFNGHEFIYRPNGKRGVHELAISLTNSQLTYPSFVMLDETFARILISPGYKDADGVMKELLFGVDEAYKHSSFEDYKPLSRNKVD